MIARERHERRGEQLLREFPVVAILGAKLVGKSSLAWSMRIAIDDLGLSQLYVVHAGEGCYPLGEKIRAVAARQLVNELRPLRR